MHYLYAPRTLTDNERDDANSTLIHGLVLGLLHLALSPIIIITCQLPHPIIKHNNIIIF